MHLFVLILGLILFIYLFGIIYTSLVLFEFYGVKSILGFSIWAWMWLVGLVMYGLLFLFLMKYSVLY